MPAGFRADTYPKIHLRASEVEVSWEKRAAHVAGELLPPPATFGRGCAGALRCWSLALSAGFKRIEL